MTRIGSNECAGEYRERNVKLAASEGMVLKGLVEAARLMTAVSVAKGGWKVKRVEGSWSESRDASFR